MPQELGDSLAVKSNTTGFDVWDTLAIPDRCDGRG